MGFLDNSTNNIIVDAVLTDYGRELLARNDGSFSIVKFALGDDEVDYTTIKKFGRTVGKEKIEKNTPIFEAQTNQNYALKYKLASFSNPTLTKMTNTTISGDIESSAGSTSPSAAQMILKRNGSSSMKTLTVEQTIADENTIDPEMRDQSFILKLPNQLVTIAGTDITPESIDSDNIATYIVPRSAMSSATGGSSLTVALQTRPISDSVYTQFGDTDNKEQISTQFEITGMQSGTSTSIALTLLK